VVAGRTFQSESQRDQDEMAIPSRASRIASHIPRGPSTDAAPERRFANNMVRFAVKRLEGRIVPRNCAGQIQDGSKFLMPEADAADHFTAVLREAGWPKANRRSSSARRCSALADELQGKSSEEIFRYFLERYTRRASQSSPSPNGVRSERDR
jgi:hypothetical protein